MKNHHVQTVRKAALLIGIVVGVALFAVTNTSHPSGSVEHAAIEWVGLVLIVACILGRTWASLYIGGRKIEELVTTGPYSVTRNPLYFFSIVGAVGMGMQFGSVVIGLFCGVIALIVFWVVINQEERVLIERYGQTFRSYMKSVPRIFPHRLWREQPVLEIYPARVVKTFGDALFFLMAWPIAETIEVLQQADALPVFFTLP